MEASLTGQHHFILAGDVAAAYNGTDRKRVEVLEWDYLKVQGQIWELARQLASGSSVRVKFHGHLTEIFKQTEGYGQGKVMSPQHFNVGMHPFLGDIEHSGGGVMIGGRLIVGIAYSDDNYTLIRTERAQEVLSGMQESMIRLQIQGKASKQFGLCPTDATGFFMDRKMPADGSGSDSDEDALAIPRGRQLRTQVNGSASGKGPTQR